MGTTPNFTSLRAKSRDHNDAVNLQNITRLNFSAIFILAEIPDVGLTRYFQYETIRPEGAEQGLYRGTNER
jgi:hypothetical protein